MFGWKTKNQGLSYRMSETSGALDGGQTVSHGLMAGTRVASNLGWRAVEALAVGDKVLTFDNGMQRVTEIRRQSLWFAATHVPHSEWPVMVPAGALGNLADVTLLPEQGVMVESDAAHDPNGDPFAVVPAAALVGVRGVARVAPMQSVELITLYFANEEVVYVDGGVLVYCPASHISLNDMLSGQRSAYDVLNAREASFLVDCLIIEDQMHVVPAAYSAQFATTF